MISCGNQLIRLDVTNNSKLTTPGIDNMLSLKEVRVRALTFPPAGLNGLMEWEF